MALSSGLCADPPSSITSKSTNHVFMTLSFALGHIHAGTGQGLLQTVAINKPLLPN